MPIKKKKKYTFAWTDDAHQEYILNEFEESSGGRAGYALHQNWGKDRKDKDKKKKVTTPCYSLRAH